MIPLYADIDERRLPTLHVDKQVEATLAAFDALLPAPKQASIEKNNRRIVINKEGVVYMGERNSDVWVWYCHAKKAFNDIVKGN